jgi:hypothetical protein
MRSIAIALLLMVAVEHRARAEPPWLAPRLQLEEVRLSPPLAAKKRRFKIAGAVILSLAAVGVVGYVGSMAALLGGPRCDWDTCNNLSAATQRQQNQELAGGFGALASAGVTAAIGATLLSFAF